ncbi:MAG: hypothetical protein QOI35_1259 [Cryptosporangiaceae bacterium]|jgi:hypothetical protein|nr:hypothetical protein [Cryptosporangiaceae bacterium]
MESMGLLSDTDELAGELYLVPPARFVATRDDLAQQARAAGHPDLARELRALRRPTQSAWLVNLLARHERPGLELLFAVGRDLSRPRSGLAGPELQRLAGLRAKRLAALLDAAAAWAADSGVVPSSAVLAETGRTLRAALADPAAAAAVLSGRLTRPLAAAPGDKAGSRVVRLPAPGEGAPGTGEDFGDDCYPHLHIAADLPAESDDYPGTDSAGTADIADTADTDPMPSRATVELAAATALHESRREELAEAEAALAAARQRLRWLDRQHSDARREKADAERRLSDAQLAEQVAADLRADAEHRTRA